MTTFQTTQLDFAQIKQSLKTFFEKQAEFADYDFAGSGLQNILDVLAYNTHYNAMIANFALNESYLSTAQLRSSVISKAQSLGYNIRSRTAAVAYLNLSVNLSGVGSPPVTVTIPSGKTFSTQIDGQSYTFRTLETVSAVNNGSGIYTFVASDGSTNIPVYEGASRTKTFLVGQGADDQVYVIPDQTMDTSTARVTVFDTYSSSTSTEYFSVVGQTSINTDSTFYRINELPNGYYEISFGDGRIYGQSPVAGNKIVVSYLSCIGADANGGTLFIPTSGITIDGTTYTLNTVTAAASAGGAAKQSIESIRKNAPISFASQQRLVTAQDYEGTILNNYSQISDVVAWGGEENDPVDYGKVFVSLKYQDGTSATTKTQVQNNIANDLNENLAILSIDIEFVDPVTTYLELVTEVYYNPDLTTRTRSALQAAIRTLITNFANTNLKTFKGIFRKSKLLTEIDAFSEAVSSSSITARLQQRLTPVRAATINNPSRAADYTLSFPVALAPADDENYSITSTTFAFNNQTALIRNRLKSNTLQVVTSSGVVLVDNVGSYTPSTGKVNLIGFAPGIISSGDPFIKVSARIANDAVIKPLRNYILDFDNVQSSVSAIVDRNQISVKL